MSAIHIRQLSHAYRMHFWSAPKFALKSLSLDVNEGEVFGYLGVNGAGKTTTIKILVGLLAASSGEASLFGKDCHLTSSRLSVGFQPENPYFYEYLTAHESLRFYAALCKIPRKIRRIRADELLDFVGLMDVKNIRVGAFSKGMRQRLGIAQALIHRPRLVILDEPQSGLDPVGRHQVRRIIEGLRDQGMTVFFSSHILSDVEMVADRVGLLVQGELQAVGKIDDLVKKTVESIRVEVEGLTLSAIEILALEGIQGANLGSRVRFLFNAWNVCEPALSRILQLGGSLRCVQESCESLEQYFMQRNLLTQHSQGAGEVE